MNRLTITWGFKTWVITIPSVKKFFVWYFQSYMILVFRFSFPLEISPKTLRVLTVNFLLIWAIWQCFDPGFPHISVCYIIIRNYLMKHMKLNETLMWSTALLRKTKMDPKCQILKYVKAASTPGGTGRGAQQARGWWWHLPLHYSHSACEYSPSCVLKICALFLM